MRWSASSLKRFCAHPNVLKREPLPHQQEAIDKGIAFHAAIEDWVRTGVLAPHADLEIDGWLQLLASQWSPPAGMRCEVAWGLSPSGEHVMVAEPRPHVYTALDGQQLLTAGRADACWYPYSGDRILSAVDWKAGAWAVAPAHENLQANAAGIALAKRFGARAYVPGIYYARDGFWDWGEPVELGSLEHAQRFADVSYAALLPETPRPGYHCGGCWSRRDCEAGQRWTIEHDAEATGGQHE